MRGSCKYLKSEAILAYSLTVIVFYNSERTSQQVLDLDMERQDLERMLMRVEDFAHVAERLYIIRRGI
jgi:hypothetical protein